MNCFESRRRLLASPRHRDPDVDAHLAACAECTRLTRQLSALDHEIVDAALVRVPDALAHKVLFARRPSGLRRFALAASLVLASAVLGLALASVWESVTSAPVQAVGPTHPAVAAISYVIEQQPAVLDEGRAGDPKIMADGLKRLGLSLKAGEVTIDYAGKCYIPGAECDHLVLNTPDGQVTVILVPDYPLDGRVMVADRRLTALVSPAGSGAYIVIAPSQRVARRAERLFVKG